MFMGKVQNAGGKSPSPIKNLRSGSIKRERPVCEVLYHDLQHSPRLDENHTVSMLHNIQHSP